MVEKEEGAMPGKIKRKEDKHFEDYKNPAYLVN